MSSEIDGWAGRTLALLSSKAPDSADQLRVILEESIKAKFGNRRILKPIPGPSAPSKQVEDARRSKNDPKKSLTEENESATGSDSSDELTMEILEDDLACVVCREMAIGPRNRLVECAECHSLYHQECHSPSISDMDVSDPRLVWYCSNCSKTVMRPKSSNNSGSSLGTKPGKSSSSPRANQSSPVTGLSSKPFGGLSANSKKSSSGSSKSSSSSSSSSKSVGNIISADKRLQIMKKRAAKKQEKRSLPK